jgi:hypothetical protein
MIENSKSFFCRVYKDERGQLIPIIAFMMVGLLGLTGMVVDVGHAYFSYQLLQNATNASAMAGAQGLLSSGTLAMSNAAAYGSQSGKANAYSNLTITNSTYTLGCVTAAVAGGTPCVSTGLSTGASTANAIQVKQTASVPTTFMRLFGFSTLSMTATGTALMKGTPAAYNIAIVLDTTASMNTTDSNCSNKTRLACALSGVQTFMKNISPCSYGSSGCSASLQRVSLFTFPNMTTGSVSNDYTCPTSNPSIGPYVFPTNSITSTTGTSIGTTGYTYQITPWASDYRSSNTSSSLVSSSESVIAVGGGTCSGVKAPGGDGTFYAGAIYQAEAALEAEQTSYPTSQNALILVSDGDANSSSSQMSSKGVNGSGSINTTGLYPSYKDECWQAVTAAQYAASHGTKVYSVAYGSSNTGCASDTVSISGTSDAYTTACKTMQNIASSPTLFYTDYGSSGGGCTAGNPVASLSNIFLAIAGQLSHARLIPNTAFPSS